MTRPIPSNQCRDIKHVRHPEGWNFGVGSPARVNTVPYRNNLTDDSGCVRLACPSKARTLDHHPQAFFKLFESAALGVPFDSPLLKIKFVGSLLGRLR